MPSDVKNESQVVLTSATRLRKIDQLRERNIGKYLPLPQLVAVGDQSSGKSSLLESITGIPFPRGQELCTRYATQITHRRDASSYISISIIPSPMSSKEDKERLERYGKHVQTAAELHAELPSILEAVNEQMEIRTAKNPNGKKTFSEDVLKIEKCGPNEDYLTIIDVPGIFRITTPGVTTDSDRELVKNMVKNYIRDSRTIILAVLPSNVDVATQEILALAEECDPKGTRTLGILTKPDLVTERSAQSVVCSLVAGLKRPLNLGYFLVQSRGGDDNDDVWDIQQRDASLRRGPWRELPEDRVGVGALRDRLQDLLEQITDKAFPKLRAEVTQLLTTAQADLAGLGPARQSEQEQRRYLANMAGKFQGMVRDALEANYSSQDAFDEDDDLRLVTKIVNSTEAFNGDFKDASHSYIFETRRTITPSGEEIEEGPRTGPQPSVASDSGEESDQSSDACFSTPEADRFPDLMSIIVDDWTVEEPREGIRQWLSSLNLRSRGLELGTFGPRLLSSAFREQSSKWPAMASAYVSQIIVTIHAFILKAMDVVCTDERVREELLTRLTEMLHTSYRNGMRQATHLANIERQKKPFTLNHYFSSNLQEARAERLKEELRKHAREERVKGFGNPHLVVPLDSIPKAVVNRSNAEQSTEDLHDILEAYYTVARKRFVDNIFSQAVDHCLLSGPESPLLLFSEQWVIELDSAALGAIAGESRQTRDQRKRLINEVTDLQAAIQILR